MAITPLKPGSVFITSSRYADTFLKPDGPGAYRLLPGEVGAAVWESEAIAKQFIREVKIAELVPIPVKDVVNKNKN